MKNIPQFILDYCQEENCDVKEYIENSKVNYVILQGDGTPVCFDSDNRPVVYGELGEEICEDFFGFRKTDEDALIITEYEYLIKHTDFVP